MAKQKPKGQWWDWMWNPIAGCTKISPGCLNCWAEGRLDRFGELWIDYFPSFTSPVGPIIVEKWFDKPRYKKKPAVVFVGALGDLFHEAISLAFHRRVYDIMRMAPQHTFVLLTKRPDAMAFSMGKMEPLPNVVCGVSICTADEYDAGWPPLDRLSGGKWRTLMCFEPLLDSVVTHAVALPPWINQVIVGCESGTRAKRRPMDDDWVRFIRCACHRAGAPFYLKQMEIDGKVVGLPKLDGKVHDDFSGVTG